MRLWHHTSLLLHIHQPLLQGKPHLFSDTYCSSYLQVMQMNYYELITKNGHNILFFLWQRVEFYCNRSIAAKVKIFLFILNFLLSDVTERTLEWRNEHAEVSKIAIIILKLGGKMFYFFVVVSSVLFSFLLTVQQSHLQVLNLASY